MGHIGVSLRFIFLLRLIIFRPRLVFMRARNPNWRTLFRVLDLFG
jgi:hypothetical protein